MFFFLTSLPKTRGGCRAPSASPPVTGLYWSRSRTVHERQWTSALKCLRFYSIITLLLFFICLFIYIFICFSGVFQVRTCVRAATPLLVSMALFSKLQATKWLAKSHSKAQTLNYMLRNKSLTAIIISPSLAPFVQPCDQQPSIYLRAKHRSLKTKVCQTFLVRYIRMSSPKLNNVIILGCVLIYLSGILIGIDGEIVSGKTQGRVCQVWRSSGILDIFKSSSNS